VPRHAPTHYRCLDRAAGFVIVPPAIDEVAWKRQLIGAAVVLAKDLDRQTRRRDSGAIKFSQSSFACCHLIYSPKYAARPRRPENPRPLFLVQSPGQI
jgi:hypothetical protein